MATGHQLSAIHRYQRVRQRVCILDWATNFNLIRMTAILCRTTPASRMNRMWSGKAIKVH